MACTKGMTLAEWQADAMRVDTSLRKSSLNGQAAIQVPDTIRAQVPDIPWRRIVGLRNRLMHAYPAKVDSAIWSMVGRDLPAFRTSLKDLLKTLPPVPAA